MPFGSQSKRRYMDYLKQNKLGMFSGGEVDDEDAPEDEQTGSFHPYDSSGEPDTDGDLEEKKPMEFMSQGGEAGQYEDSEDEMGEDDDDQEKPHFAQGGQVGYGSQDDDKYGDFKQDDPIGYAKRQARESDNQDFMKHGMTFGKMTDPDYSYTGYKNTYADGGMVEKIQRGEMDPSHDEQMDPEFPGYAGQEYGGGMSRDSRFKYAKGGRVDRGFAQALRKKMAYGGSC